MGRGMKRAAALLAAVLLLTLFAPLAGAADMQLSSQTLVVNGAAVSCDAWNIDGSNYYMLRDLAMLLSGTGSRFSVSYDREKQAVEILRGEDYTPTGSELAPAAEQPEEIWRSVQPVLIDGVEHPELSAWNIDGSNYYRLRDLGEALGFFVDYDPEAKTIYLRTPFLPGQARLTETEDAGREYLDKIIFLGECTTYGIGYYYRHGYTELCPSSQVWTPKEGYMYLAKHATAKINYTLTGEQLSIVECAKRSRPEILIITLGLKGFGAFTEESYKNHLRTLTLSIREASPNTEVILNTIYPVADSYAYQSLINNEKICEFNGWIESLAEELGCRFLNGFEALAVDGKLPEKLQNGDGLHLAGEAYALVMQYIRTHAIPSKLG